MTSKGSDQPGICAVWSEPLLVTWIFNVSKATDRTSFLVSKLKRRLHRLVWVYTCQNTTLLDITCPSSYLSCWWMLKCQQLLLLQDKFHAQLCWPWKNLITSKPGAYGIVFLTWVLALAGNFYWTYRGGSRGGSMCSLEPPFETKLFHFMENFRKKSGKYRNDQVKLTNRTPLCKFWKQFTHIASR